MSRFLNLLVYSNLLIASCSTSLSYIACSYFKVSETNNILGFVFFATLFVYSFHRKVDHLYYGNRKLTPQDKWIESKKRFYTFLILSSFSIAFYYYLGLPKSANILLFPLFIISILYVLQINIGLKLKTLRSIPYLKPFVIAFVWGGISSMLPVICQDGVSALLSLKVHLFALAMSFSVFGQAIPFDIRDIELDRSASLKTLPQLLGINNVKFLSFISYSFSVVSLWIISSEVNLLIVSFTIGLSSSAIIISKLNNKNPYLHYSLVLEGSLAFPFICFIILSHF